MQATTTVAHWFSSAAARPQQPLVHQLALLPEPAQPWCCWDLVCPEEAWALDGQELPLRWGV